MASNSSFKGLRFRERFRECSKFFMMCFRGLCKSEDFGWLWKNIAEYEAGDAGFAGKKITDAAVLEIGCGARTHRLHSLLSMGANASGVDLNAPLLRGWSSEFAAVLSKSGPELAVFSDDGLYSSRMIFLSNPKQQ